ncbi:hypothetical protein EIP91_003054 [Steccherinum ochraceum]|uniref:ER-bound oxygenase mpaB/mpaB'/Rubber oxygenase catalytic domain-containing protein n=1 Tax=Steccherinum ochraceum TaxID=92696 RepID=A0A4R0REH1_9APHY|nr:hypothetical protein EIP91_003054 [Steccherinum ochraceum]
MIFILLVVAIGSLQLFSKSYSGIRKVLLSSQHIRLYAQKLGQPKKNPPSTHIDAFFALYSTFDYDSTKPIMHEFFRLSEQQEWVKDVRKEKTEELRAAMVSQFSVYYGTEVDDINAWRGMCTTLGLDPTQIPQKVTACRARVKKTHANLVDYVEAKRLGTQVRIFPQELSHGVHIDEYFARHRTFNYDSFSPVMDEFHGMAKALHWGSKKIQKEKRKLRDALAMQFNDYFGTDVDDVNAWRSMCVVLGVEMIPEDMRACRKIVKRAHANIIDYIDAKRLGQRVRKFPSLKTLAKYTYAEDKVFPKEQAKAGGVLKYLLRTISVYGEYYD